MGEKYNQILTLILTAKYKMSPNFDEKDFVIMFNKST